MLLEKLDRLPNDPILGLMAAFRADTDPRKVDLGVGVYRDERGETPVLEAVRRAEQQVLAQQTTKSYVAPAGNAAFNQAMERLVFGEGHTALNDKRVRTIQTPGGCGALRLGAELLRTAGGEVAVHVSTPTWANHVPLLGGARLALERYPYFDAATGGVDFAAMLTAISRLPADSIVLLHASCHNPTGADLDAAQWQELLSIFKERRLLPFIDMAYQGLGKGMVEDAYGIRLFAAELPEVLVAVSCSKNFGLYRERTGALHIISSTPTAADAVMSQLVRIARTIYSMPPDHGAAIVAEILNDEGLRNQWFGEVKAMRERINGLRHALVEGLARAQEELPVNTRRDFGFIARQQGMFSFLGITPEQVRELREKHHIYMTDDSRINIAGVRSENLNYFVQAVSQVLPRHK